MNFRLLAVLVVTLMSGSALAAEPVARLPGPGSRLVAAMQQEPATLNPVIGTLAVEGDASNLIFDGLLRHDAAGQLVPDLARRVPTKQNGDIGPDGRTVTYHLVHTARWHDGLPVTSQDVKFTWEAVMDARNTVANRSGYDEIASVSTPDDWTVVFHLKRPWAPLVEQIFTGNIQGAIVPAHLLRDVPDFNRAAFNSSPVGSGPYRLVTWTRGTEMRFEANPQYFRGAPHIPRIVWHFIPDQNAIANGLRTGEVDLAVNYGVVPYAQLGKLPGVIPALGPSVTWEHLTFNTGSGPLQDVRVRRALCTGMDVNELFVKVAHGIGTLGAAFQHPASPWHLASVRPCAFDPDGAAKLLDAAGWRRGADGMRTKDGKPLLITFGTVAGVVDREQIQVLLQARWRQLGVDTVVRAYTPSLFFAPFQSGGILYGGKVDVALSAFFLSSLDPSDIAFDSADTIPPAGINAAYWRDARVTKLEQEGASTYDAPARRKAYDEIQRIVASDVPYVTIRWWESIAMHKLALHGVQPPLVGSTYWNAKDWTF